MIIFPFSLPLCGCTFMCSVTISVLHGGGYRFCDKGEKLCQTLLADRYMQAFWPASQSEIKT